ncbi:WD-repeat protein, putative [Ricinus communis]|uniref:WD-repeat protein, putative n=1 Tax=Ricinus communis TaxID=3988 RepID=B9T1Y8_RICCO|nr:WD-repeat protein, putative [Ricinus communis]|eukprot:XP_002532257.1 DDB1- and CUL4-associated factor 8 [Ricinus communis]
MELPYRGIKDGLPQIYKRELGLFQPRNFSQRYSASEGIVKQISLYKKLLGHEGCVNSVEFNYTGDLLVSGSDDKQVMFWDWVTGTRTISYPSGHFGNIFQTKIMPFTDDRKIVTSSADGQVRVGQVLENGQVDTKKLGKHQGRVYKLAVEPGSPHILYSCGEDGFVQHFDLRSWSATKLFCCSSFSENSRRPSNWIRLNAIVIDPRNPHYFAVGGSDEYARVYDIRKCRWDASSNSDIAVNTFCPRHLIGTKNVHITGLAYSSTSELLASYNDELIYLFQKSMGMGPYPLSISSEDLQKLEEPQVYLGHRNSKTVKGVSFFGPNDEYVLSGSDCGNIFIWKKQGGKLVRLMFGDRQVVNQFDPHPHMPMFATCGIEKSVKLWIPMASEDSSIPDNVEKIMESNRQGREDHSQVSLTPDVIMHVLRLQRRQTLAYIERRYSRGDVESDEDEGDAYVLGFSAGDASSEEGSEGNSRECNIS